MSSNRSSAFELINASDVQNPRSQRILFRALGVTAAILLLHTLSACTVTREYAGDAKRGEGKQERAQRMEESREQTQEKVQELAREQEARTQLMEWRQKMQTATARLGEKLRFATGSSELSLEAREELRSLSSLMVQQPNEKLRLKGFTDNRGPLDVNQTLAQSRVDAVRSELINQGVPSDQIEIVAAGEVSPVATNTTAAGRAKNRRVEIEMLSPPSG